jgi:HSP20 family protein
MFDLMPWRKRYGNELVGLKSEMDKLFNRFFDSDFPLTTGALQEGQWAPRIDIIEGKNDITVQAEIPGCDVKDLDVSLDGRILTIKGEKKHEKEEKDKNYLRVERAQGYFSRTMELPTEVDQTDINANYKKGVLKVVLKKTESKEGRKIEIKTS